MGARLTAALLAGRMATGLSRRLGRGGGTVIAGHVVPRIDPTALRTVTRRLRHGTVLVSGTNGKTTTSRLISHILQQGEILALHNRAGANLVTGLVSAVVAQTSLGGWPRADVGLFEVDEATVPAALREIRPRAVLLTNIFRDQLDRYGEVHFVADLWAKAIRHLLARHHPGPERRRPAGRHARPRASIERRRSTSASAMPASGAARSRTPRTRGSAPSCGTAFAYDVHYYGHLGRYACPELWPGPPGAVRRGDQRHAPGRPWHRGHDPDAARRDPGDAQPAGPLQRLQRPRRHRRLPLARAGPGDDQARAGELHRRLRAAGAGPGRRPRAVPGAGQEPGRVRRGAPHDPDRRAQERTLVIAINDNFADGTDISWLWDVDFERLEGHVSTAICSGTRAEDMAVRLKYALVPEDRIVVEADPRRALAVALERAVPGETVYVLPTYTAMLELREVLRQDGHVAGFWQD